MEWPEASRGRSCLRRLLDFVKEPINADYSHEDIFRMALVLTPLWFIGNIFYNYSLSLTSISSSTVIRYWPCVDFLTLLQILHCSNTSGVFTLLFSWLFGIEDITSGKILGLLLCLAGVALVAVQDERNSDDSSAGIDGIVGDIVAVIGALCYGLYTTILKLKVALPVIFMQLLVVH